MKPQYNIISGIVVPTIIKIGQCLAMLRLMKDGDVFGAQCTQLGSPFHHHHSHFPSLPLQTQNQTSPQIHVLSLCLLGLGTALQVFSLFFVVISFTLAGVIK